MQSILIERLLMIIGEKSKLIDLRDDQIRWAFALKEPRDLQTCLNSLTSLSLKLNGQLLESKEIFLMAKQDE